MTGRWIFLLSSFASCLLADTGNYTVLELKPTALIPRNSEGSFVTLTSGAVAFYYTQFYGGNEDHSPARIAAIESKDDGRTWSEPRLVIAGVGDQGLNVMSVSVLRLASGRLALFFLSTQSKLDCRPYLCLSTDEGLTWSKPRLLLESPGYFILNNDRVIQTRGGRLILPMNRHARAGERGIAVWYLSDDEGETWRESRSRWGVADGKSGLQESGVVETPGDGLLSWARTDLGTQYESRSSDGGETWSAPRAGPLVSPLSPASIERMPGRDDLLAFYNDHSGKFPFVPGMRAPLIAAVSSDGGRTWPVRRSVEADRTIWYHYVAIHFVKDVVLIAYNAGDDRMAKFTSALRIRRINSSWFFGKD